MQIQSGWSSALPSLFFQWSGWRFCRSSFPPLEIDKIWSISQPNWLLFPKEDLTIKAPQASFLNLSALNPAAAYPFPQTASTIEVLNGCPNTFVFLALSITHFPLSLWPFIWKSYGIYSISAQIPRNPIKKTKKQNLFPVLTSLLQSLKSNLKRHSVGECWQSIIGDATVLDRHSSEYHTKWMNFFLSNTRPGE